jgi:hypothetical protein
MNCMLNYSIRVTRQFFENTDNADLCFEGQIRSVEENIALWKLLISKENLTKIKSMSLLSAQIKFFLNVVTFVQTRRRRETGLLNYHFGNISVSLIKSHGKEGRSKYRWSTLVIFSVLILFWVFYSLSCSWHRWILGSLKPYLSNRTLSGKTLN